MAQYPTNPATFRDKENRPGNEYDETKKRVLFVEDMEAIEDEITEVEERLMPETDNPLPFGLRIGDPDTHIEIKKFTPVPGLDIPMIRTEISDPTQPESLGLPTFTGIMMSDDGFGALAFVSSDGSSSNIFAFIDIVKTFIMQGKLSMEVENMDIGVDMTIFDSEDNIKQSMTIRLDEDNGDLWFRNYVKINSAGLHTWGKYYIDGDQGITGSFDVISNLRFDGGTLQKKTRTITYKGGIITNKSDESDWIDVS